MLEFLISLGLLGCVRQIRDVIVLWIDEQILRRKELRCPVCLSKHIWKDGHGKRKNRCPIQRFYCVGCGRSFCTNTLAPWYWCKYSSASIVLFLWYILSGDSILHTREICSFSPKIPTWKTLWSWLLKFGTYIINRYKSITPKVSRYRAWQNDEMYLRNRPIIGTVDPQTNTIFLTTSWRADYKNILSHMSRVVTKWKKKPRGWWTDEWKAYPKAFVLLDEKLPHSTVKHKNWQFKNPQGITTNAIENIWRQYRKWLHRKNGLKHQAYVSFYTDLFETKYNSAKNPMLLVDLLL